MYQETVGVVRMEEQIKLLMQVNAQQRTQIEQLNALLQFQIEQNQALTAKIDELLQRIDELSHKKNSRNSSAPPSSDGYAKPAPKSQRKTSGAKPGGQAGHKGSSMKLMKEPDEVKPLHDLLLEMLHQQKVLKRAQTASRKKFCGVSRSAMMR